MDALATSTDAMEPEVGWTIQIGTPCTFGQFAQYPSPNPATKRIYERATSFLTFPSGHYEARIE